MSSRFVMPFANVGDGITPADGAKLQFYASGTSTPKDTYSDEDLTTANANPVVADADGVFGDIWMNDGDRYKVQLLDKNDVQSWEADPVIGGLRNGALGLIYDTVAAMKLASPVVGSAARTLGYYAAGDGGGGEYIIEVSASVDGYGDHTLANGNIATLQANDINVLQYGAKDSTDSTEELVAAFAAGAGKTILIPDGNEFLYDTALASLGMATDKTTLTGGGKIKATSSSNNLILVSGDECQVRNSQFEGDGTFTSDKTTASDDRIALIRVTGDNCSVYRNTLTKGHQSFIQFSGVTGGAVFKNELHGGITSYDPNTDTGYQGIRVVDSQGVSIERNQIFELSSGKTAEAIYCGAHATTVSNDNIISGNIVHAAWDHGVYLNVSHGCEVSHNMTETDAAGVVCASLFDTTLAASYRGNQCIGNIIKASATVTGTVGLSFRDANGSTVALNQVDGFARGIQMSPVTYSSANLTMNNNKIIDNMITGANDTGILVGAAGLTIGECKNNQIRGNTVIGKALSSSVGCSFVFSAGISKSNSICSNDFVESGDIGISVQSFDNGEILSNNITDVARSAATNKTGIYLVSCTATKVEQNNIVDGLGSPLMLYGISGGNNCQSCSVRFNTILNAQTVPIRQFQQSGHKNTFEGNITGLDSLQGEVTLAAATTTTITNDNINAGAGMVSYVDIEPINQAAATLVSGANSPFVGAGDMTAGTSFKIRQTGAAAGTELFRYRISQ